MIRRVSFDVKCDGWSWSGVTGMRCDFCKFSNPPAVATCQSCGARLPGVACSRCYFENPTENRFCGRCGQPLSGSDQEEQSQQARRGSDQGRVYEAVPTSVVYVVGLGAILVVASLVYPWYFLGDQAAAEDAPASILNQFTTGWKWFPGVPMVVIIVSSVMSSILALLAHRGKVHPAPCLMLALVSLAAAIWLWQGIATGEVNPADWELAPMLATIGAIILLVGGSMTAGPLLRR